MRTRGNRKTGHEATAVSRPEPEGSQDLKNPPTQVATFVQGRNKPVNEGGTVP
jgi:hypothetical protein